eukprot:scaffold38523_cov40-Attheya_sp.AAC.1
MPHLGFLYTVRVSGYKPLNGLSLDRRQRLMLWSTYEGLDRVVAAVVAPVRNTSVTLGYEYCGH